MMMSRLVRKCSVTAGELWVPDMTNCTLENHAITNETAMAKMSLHRVRSPLSGSFSVDYLCKYIATPSPKIDITSMSSNAAAPLDCDFPSQDLEEMSNSSLSTNQDSISPGILGLSEQEEPDMDSVYVSFPPVDDVSASGESCNQVNSHSTRTILGSISNSIRKRAASV
ncbi:hypothetical protein K7432_013579 [Basidiobolus ranarum]|uniref:Uncharacterized protein n=1 Tax=Basidiobolus ranarum TaxID=34480 RepID=A0ABR2VRI2_9FUNG